MVSDVTEQPEFRVKWAALRLLTALARDAPFRNQQVKIFYLYREGCI